MEYWWQWTLSILGSSAGAAAALAIAGYLGRAKLSHWLNKDLEEVKARHQRELEAYRTSLIAEAERTKAEQAVKTAKALRIADKEFVAVERLHLALVPYAAAAMVYLEHFNSATREADWIKLNDVMREFTDAERHASIFLTGDDRKIFFDLQDAFSTVVEAALKLKAPMEPKACEVITAPLVEKNAAASQVVARLVKRMHSMA
jgi:hypothetical protein